MKKTPPTTIKIYYHSIPDSRTEIDALIPNGRVKPYILASMDMDGFDAIMQNHAGAQAHIIGFSMGAMTALRLAALRPDAGAN